jgi:hypothetical protein
VDKDLRVSLVAAGAASALSALVGLIAGVGFLTLLFRALVGGIVIGGAAFGVILLLKQAMPGLLEGGGDSLDEAIGGESAKGANLDIVLPGEGPTAEAFAPEGEEGEGFATLESLGPGPRRGEAAEEDAADMSPVDGASLLEPEGPAGEAAALPAVPPPERDRTASPGFDELDVLPDLEGFSDSFTASEFSSGGSASESAQQQVHAGHVGSASRSGQDGFDPASLAKAVRTILKRDQKG